MLVVDTSVLGVFLGRLCGGNCRKLGVFGTIFEHIRTLLFGYMRLGIYLCSVQIDGI